MSGTFSCPYGGIGHVMPSKWFEPIASITDIDLSKYVDTEHDVSFDTNRPIVWAFGSVTPTWPCGGSINISHDDCINISLRTYSEVSAMDIVALCAAWKHEVEHVRQLTGACHMSEMADKHLAFEQLAMANNEFFYLDNYGRMVFELNAYKSGYSLGVEMAHTVLNDIGFACSEYDAELAMLTEIDIFKMSVTGEREVFAEDDFFESIDAFEETIHSRSQAVRDGVDFETRLLHYYVNHRDGGYELEDGCESIAWYLIESNPSEEFVSHVLGTRNNLDILKCLAAVTCFDDPKFAARIAVLDESDFQIGDYNPYVDVREHRPTHRFS